MKVIGVVGLPASGKGEFSKIAAEAGIPVIVMGDMIRAAVTESGTGTHRYQFRCNSKPASGRKRHGCDCCTVRTGDKAARPLLWSLSMGYGEMLKSGCSGSTFPRLRSSASILRLKNGWTGSGHAVVPMILSCPNPCVTRDEREMNWGLMNALAEADIKIKNEGSLEEFSTAVISVLASLGRDP